MSRPLTDEEKLIYAQMSMLMRRLDVVAPAADRAWREDRRERTARKRRGLAEPKQRSRPASRRQGVTRG